MNSFELLTALKQLGHLHEERDPWWWPRSGSLEVVVGALLTQQTRWEKVEESLKNLKQADCLNLENLADINSASLSQLIRPSGFYNTKAPRLKQLAIHVLREFGDFDAFRNGVTREWLLHQNGIGMETADSILCYACYRPAMVADAYSQRLLHALGIEANGYTAVQNWLTGGLESRTLEVSQLYDSPMSQAQIYARFHGKIVEYCKTQSRGKSVNVSHLSEVRSAEFTHLSPRSL